MRKRIPHEKDAAESGHLAALFCLMVCFAAGTVFGCGFAGLLSGEAQERLFAYLNSYFSGLAAGGAVFPSLLSVVWELVRWPLLVFALGFTAFGLPGIPAAFVMRGFFLSYAVAVFVRLYGGAGLLVSLAVFGVAGFMTLPVLFVLGMDGLRNVKALTDAFREGGKRCFSFQSGYFSRAGGCCALLAAASAVQFWLSPLLLRAAADFLLG